MKNILLDEFESNQRICKHSTKWLNFYVRYLMIIWIIFGILASFSYLNYDVYVGQFSPTQRITFFIAGLLIVILTLITRPKLLRFSKDGYKLNIILICASVLNLLISLILNIGNTIMVLSSFCMIVVRIFIYVVPNLIYFNKRKDLFNN